MNIKTTTLLFTAALALPVTSIAASVPQGGMSKADVRSQFGAPEETRPAVGDPPISRWKYADFTVYFEHDLTLHSVRNNAGLQAPRVISGEQSQSPAAAPEQAAPPAVEHDQDSATSSPAPAPAPEKAPAPTSKSAPSSAPEKSGSFRFDPTSGRIIMENDSAPAQPAAEDSAEPAQTAAPDAPEPAPTAAPEPEPAQPADQIARSDTQQGQPASDESGEQGGFFIDWNKQQ